MGRTMSERITITYYNDDNETDASYTFIVDNVSDVFEESNRFISFVTGETTHITIIDEDDDDDLVFMVGADNTIQ